MHFLQLLVALYSHFSILSTPKTNFFHIFLFFCKLKFTKGVFVPSDSDNTPSPFLFYAGNFIIAYVMQNASILKKLYKNSCNFFQLNIK